MFLHWRTRAHQSPSRFLWIDARSLSFHRFLGQSVECLSRTSCSPWCDHVSCWVEDFSHFPDRMRLMIEINSDKCACVGVCAFVFGGGVFPQITWMVEGWPLSFLHSFWVGLCLSTRVRSSALYWLQRRGKLWCRFLGKDWRLANFQLIDTQIRLEVYWDMPWAIAAIIRLDLSISSSLDGIWVMVFSKFWLNSLNSLIELLA